MLFRSVDTLYAAMAELADALALGTSGETRAGSIPASRTNYMGWITNGELGETANLSVLLIEYSWQNRIIPPCIFTFLLAVALKLCLKQLLR